MTTPTPESLGLDTPDLNDLIRDGAENITVNAQVLAQLWSTRGHAQVLGSGADLNTLTSGPYVANGSTTLNVPAPTHGVVLTYSNANTPGTSRVQLYYELGTAGRIWSRFRGTGSWTAWARRDPVNASERLPAGTNLDNIRDNRSWIAYPGLDDIVNAPEGATNGIVQTFYVQELSRVQLYYELGTRPMIWRRFRGTGSWTAWSRIDAAYAIEQMSEMIGDGGGGEPPSALKTLPVVLSASTSFPPVTVAAGGVRFPLNVNAPITRWRLCIRNHNYRTDVGSPGGASFTGLWVGPRSGQTAAFASAPTQISGPFSLPANGVEYATPWSSTPIGGGADMLLSLGWTGAGEATRSPAGCYRSTSSTTGGATSGAGYTRDVSVPFSWWLEVETEATTPVVAIWGDSISCGTGNDFPIHESPLSQYCRRIGALPFHAGYPGTSMTAFEPSGSNYPAWSRFEHLSRPDAVLHFMGQNDLITADLPELQRRFEATIGLLGRHVSQNIYVATLTPTSTKTEAQNTIRKNYNNWLRTLPFGVRDVFEFGPAVANGADDALAAWADSGDALHLSTAGSTALAATITRPVTTERTDRDTGTLDITAQATNIASGAVTFQHKNGWNTLMFRNVTLTGTGTVNLFPGNNPTLGPWAPEGPTEANETLVLGNAGADYRRAAINYIGGTNVYGVTAGDVLNGSITWPMNRPMP